MSAKVTRQFTPGPWHDGLAAAWKFAMGADERNAVAKKFGLLQHQMVLVYAWTILGRREFECPVK